MSCKCQSCGKQFKIDLMISDDKWEEIKPKDSVKGAGLLCGSCIMNRLEAMNNYDVISDIKEKENE